MFTQVMFLFFYILVPLILIIWFVYRFVYKPLKHRPKKTEPISETEPDFHPVDCPAQFPSEPE